MPLACIFVSNRILVCLTFVSTSTAISENVCLSVKFGQPRGTQSTSLFSAQINLKHAFPARLVVLERTRRFVLVVCSRSTKHAGRNFLNSRSSLENPPFACSLDSYTVSTAFKRWILSTSSGVQEPIRNKQLSDMHESVRTGT